MAASRYLGPGGTIPADRLPLIAISSSLEPPTDPEVSDPEVPDPDDLATTRFVPVLGLVKALAVFLDDEAAEMEACSSESSPSRLLWHRRFLRDMLQYLGHSRDEVDTFPDPAVLACHLDCVSFGHELAALGLCMRDAALGRGAHSEASNHLLELAKSAASSLVSLMLLEVDSELQPLRRQRRF